MSYRVIFDVSKEPIFDPMFFWGGLALVFVGFLYVAASRQVVLNSRKENSNKLSKRKANLFLFFTIALFILNLVHSYLTHNQLSFTAPSMIEGVVEQFKPMNYAGHDYEKFCISNTCFTYSDFTITGGFNNTSSHGGPIKQGLNVRVYYIENVIVKIELKE